MGDLEDIRGAISIWRAMDHVGLTLKGLRYGFRRVCV